MTNTELRRYQREDALKAMRQGKSAAHAALVYRQDIGELERAFAKLQLNPEQGRILREPQRTRSSAPQDATLACSSETARVSTDVGRQEGCARSVVTRRARHPKHWPGWHERRSEPSDEARVKVKTYASPTWLYWVEQDHKGKRG